jgi:fused signal recognition particle receptor
MFGSLKKRLKESIKGLAKRAKIKEEEPARTEEVTEKKPKAVRKKPEKVKPEKKKEIKKAMERPPEKIPEKPEAEEIGKEAERPGEIPEKIGEEKPRLGLRERLRARITEKALSPEDIDDFFGGQETELLQSNIAVEVVDFIRQRLKNELAGKPMPRGKAEERIRSAFREILLEIVDQGGIDILETLKGDGESKPCFVFLGFNGSGKTTSIAKVARYLLDRKKAVVLAAGDCFRAASIEQLQHHGDSLGVKVVKHDYGADSAAVIFDAIKYAESHGADIVLADTAGRSHADKNLMDELKKVARVNRPRLKILVIDSLTGNDAVEQARRFHEAVGVDAVIMSKADVNEKGGSILSVCYAIKKPILFLGTGQGYKDIEKFEPKKFVDSLLA